MSTNSGVYILDINNPVLTLEFYSNKLNNVVFRVISSHGNFGITNFDGAEVLIDYKIPLDENWIIYADSEGERQLISTGLLNYDQPLIRYRIGDRVRVAEDQTTNELQVLEAFEDEKIKFTLNNHTTNTRVILAIMK